MSVSATISCWSPRRVYTDYAADLPSNWRKPAACPAMRCNCCGSFPFECFGLCFPGPGPLKPRPNTFCVRCHSMPDVKVQYIERNEKKRNLWYWVGVLAVLDNNQKVFPATCFISVLHCQIKAVLIKTQHCNWTELKFGLVTGRNFSATPEAEPVAPGPEGRVDLSITARANELFITISQSLIRSALLINQPEY